MQEKKKFHRPPSNTVYNIDGVSYGLDDGLVEAIKTSIRRRLESNSLDVPRLPQVAGRILQLSENPNTTIDEIVQTIITDPMLAARILTIANSAAYGSGGIEGLKPALMRLGSKTVQDMVFAESIRMRIFSVKSHRAILEQSWKLSLGTAAACTALADATGLERDSAFLMGLLHDTGKPILVNAVLEYEKQNKGQSLAADMVEILMSQLHEEVGCHVLREWKMPPTVVEAAGGHHRYRGKASATPAHSLVFAANLICQHLGIGDVKRDIDFTIQHVFADLDLANLEKVTPILESVAAEVEGMMAGLGELDQAA